MTERWLSIWQQSSFEMKDAVFAAASSSMAITGLVKEEAVLRTMKRPGEKMLAKDRVWCVESFSTD